MSHGLHNLKYSEHVLQYGLWVDEMKKKYDTLLVFSLCFPRYTHPHINTHTNTHLIRTHSSEAHNVSKEDADVVHGIHVEGPEECCNVIGSASARRSLLQGHRVRGKVRETLR